MEKPVTFVNRNGCRLFGMLYLPDKAPSRRIGIVISVNAVKYRVGTFRLHVMLARALCALGYSVLSFDPEGIGDSEGEFEFKLLSEHYYDIQTGKYSNDLSDAIDFFYKECQLDSLLLLGLCGGAISVLMEGGQDERVSGLILLNIPVLLEDLNRQEREDNSAKITSTESASKLLKEKLQRLVEAAFWKRVLSGKVDFREEFQLVGKSLKVLGNRSWATLRKGVVGGLTPAISTHRLFNVHFQRAFLDSMADRKQLLFVFAELDQWTWIFKSEFQDLVLRDGNPYAKQYAIDLIRSSNHIFSGRESQQQLEATIVGWLGQHFPIGPTSP